MFERIRQIFADTLPKAVSSVVVNGYFAAKKFFMGQATPSTATADFATETAKEIVFETARVSLNHAADLMPAGRAVKEVVRTMSDMTVRSIQAGFEGQHIGKTFVKNGLYALNTAAFSPLGPIAPVFSYGAGYATDYAVEQAANKIDFAYTNYKNRNDQRAYQQNFSHLDQSMLQERVVDESLNDSFILLKPLAPAA